MNSTGPTIFVLYNRYIVSADNFDLIWSILFNRASKRFFFLSRKLKF